MVFFRLNCSQAIKRSMIQHILLYYHALKRMCFPIHTLNLPWVLRVLLSSCLPLHVIYVFDWRQPFPKDCELYSNKEQIFAGKNILCRTIYHVGISLGCAKAAAGVCLFFLLLHFYLGVCFYQGLVLYRILLSFYLAAQKGVGTAVPGVTWEQDFFLLSFRDKQHLYSICSLLLFPRSKSVHLKVIEFLAMWMCCGLSGNFLKKLINKNAE